VFLAQSADGTNWTAAPAARADAITSVPQRTAADRAAIAAFVEHFP
jgi:hypothetical protein